MNLYFDLLIFSGIKNSLPEHLGNDWKNWLLILLVILINWIGMALSWKFKTPIFQLIGYAVMLLFWGFLLYKLFENVAVIFHTAF